MRDRHLKLWHFQLSLSFSKSVFKLHLGATCTAVFMYNLSVHPCHPFWCGVKTILRTCKLKLSSIPCMQCQTEYDAGGKCHIGVWGTNCWNFHKMCALTCKIKCVLLRKVIARWLFTRLKMEKLHLAAISNLRFTYMGWSITRMHLMCTRQT